MRKGLLLECYSRDGIGILNPILGMGLDYYPSSMYGIFTYIYLNYIYHKNHPNVGIYHTWMVWVRVCSL